MNKKKSGIKKSMEEEYLKRAQDYAKHILQRQPIPPELKLKGLESKEASIQSRLEFLENTKKKMLLIYFVLEYVECMKTEERYRNGVLSAFS